MARKRAVHRLQLLVIFADVLAEPFCFCEVAFRSENEIVGLDFSYERISSANRAKRASLLASTFHFD